MASLVLLVVALGTERHAIHGALQARRTERLGDRPAIRGHLAGREVLLVQAGIGRERAREAVAAASRKFDVRAAWSLGFAGGLTESLRPGDLVYPTAILEDRESARLSMHGGTTHATVCAALRRAALRIESGAVITLRAALRTPEAKRAVARQSGAVAVEMEAAGVVRAARDLGIPCAALKVIVDAVDDPLPPFVGRCTTPQGDLRWRGLLAGVLEGRESWRSLYRLGQASRQAGRSLWQGLEVAFGAWVALTPY
jgi:adenosylhomocysteine nucleosidase